MRGEGVEDRQLITEGGRVLGRAERVEEAAVGGHRGGDLEDERARGAGAPPPPGRLQRPGLQIREAHRRSLPSSRAGRCPASSPSTRSRRAAKGGGGGRPDSPERSRIR